MHEKSLFYQSQVSVTLEAELKEINLQIEKAKQTEESAIQQAKTADKAELAKALYAALESLRQAKVDKEQELVLATKQASLAQEDLEKVQRDLSLTRVEIKKHEKLGHKKSIDHLRALVAEMSALSQRLNETSLENIDPSLHGTPSAPLGIRQLIELSNADIDRICTQAATFASDDHVDVEACPQLATIYSPPRAPLAPPRAPLAPPAPPRTPSRPLALLHPLALSNPLTRCGSSLPRCSSTTLRCASSSTPTPRASSCKPWNASTSSAPTTAPSSSQAPWVAWHCRTPSRSQASPGRSAGY